MESDNVSVVNGQPANETIFNDAFVSKTSDSTVQSNINLADTDTSQGNAVSQTQRELNSINSFTGHILNTAKDVKPSWATSNYGGATDSLQARSEALDVALASTDADVLAVETELLDKTSSVANDTATGANATLSVVATTLVRLTDGSLTSIDMIPAASTAREIVLLNRTGNSININNETGATAADRILTGTGAQIALADSAALVLAYDLTSARWQIVGGSGGGSGGGNIGSVGLDYIESTNAPVFAQTAIGINYYEYEPALSQALYLLIKVPDAYLPGNQIFLYGMWQNADSSGNALLSTQSTLIRVGTDGISSTTNQRTSTNSAVTMSGGNQDISQEIVFDLTDSSGQINSVAVSAGDLIKIRIYENASTTASPLWYISNASEVTFS